MKKKDIVAFAKENGYDDVVSLGEWKGYQVYEPIIKGTTEEEPALIGPPLLILVKDDKIRMSTPEEAYEQMDA